MGNFYMEATQINYRRDDKPKTVDQKLKELSETSAIDTDIAPVFKSTSTYKPGDMVYYSNKLYVFNVEHTGTWADADVTATDVTTEISSLKSGLTSLLVVEQISKSYAVTTGGRTYFSIASDIVKTGYTPLGIVGFMINEEGVFPINMSIGSNQYSIYLNNLSDSDKSGTMYFNILYRKNA